jgi:STE24 endopeptidase
LPSWAADRAKASGQRHLIGLGIGLASLPVLTAVSSPRRWERAADRYSPELPGDKSAYEVAFPRLARMNLTDLDPPRLRYLPLFAHPTPSECLAAAA